jgi:hypothetical protein
MTNHDLLRKLADVPFKPFRVKMSNSTSIDFKEPGTVIVGDSSAVLPVETYVDDKGFRIVRNWKTIALSHIVKFPIWNRRLMGRNGRSEQFSPEHFSVSCRS